MKTIAVLVLALVCFGAGALLGPVVVQHWPANGKPSAGPVTTPPTEDRPTSVTALGRIEPAGGLVTVGVFLPDRIAHFAKGIRKGAVVDAGAALVVLESQRDRQDDYDLASMQCADADAKRQQIAAVGAQRIELEALRKKQLDAMEPLQTGLQQARIALLEKQLEAAHKNLKRVGEVGSGVVSSQEREQQQLLVFQAQSELQAARDVLEQKRLESQLERQLIEAKLVAARAELSKNLLELPIGTLKRQKEIAKRKLDETTLRAPCRGEILELFAAAGEIVGGQQPILQLADTAKMAVVAEVYETDIGRVHRGQPVEVKSRVWGEQVLTGVVDNIGNMIAKNRIIDADPTANIDRRVLEVRILLDRPLPAATLIHHQVTVYFRDDARAK